MGDVKDLGSDVEIQQALRGVTNVGDAVQISASEQAIIRMAMASRKHVMYAARPLLPHRLQQSVTRYAPITKAG